MSSSSTSPNTQSFFTARKPGCQRCVFQLGPMRGHKYWEGASATKPHLLPLPMQWKKNYTHPKTQLACTYMYMYIQHLALTCSKLATRYSPAQFLPQHKVVTPGTTWAVIPSHPSQTSEVMPMSGGAVRSQSQCLCSRGVQSHHKRHLCPRKGQGWNTRGGLSQMWFWGGVLDIACQ